MLELVLFGLLFMGSGAAGVAPQSVAQSAAPLTVGEMEQVRVQVQKCWNVGGLSTQALRSTVTLAFEMNRDATPVGASIRKVAPSDNSEATRQAYEAARRAVIRCGAGGLPLSVGKYDHWQSVEMTFDPAGMRIR